VWVIPHEEVDVKKSRFLSLLVLVIFIVASVVPAFGAGDMSKLKVKNNTKDSFTLRLTGNSGEGYYTFSVKRGNNNFEVKKGTYSYTHDACGQTNTGNLNAKGNTAKLNVKKCPKGSSDSSDSGLVKLTIKNSTGETVTLRLTGAGYYTFTLKNGNNKVEVKAGTYDYSYKACDETFTGKLNAKGKSAKLNLKKCKGGGGKSAKGGSIRIKFENQTGSTMTVYMYGPKSYTFTVPPGKSTVQVDRGEYSYTYYLSCGSGSGSYKFNKNTRWRFWCN
jgi:hypothetical protein